MRSRAAARRARTLADEWRAAGTQRFHWDGRDDAGEDAGAGLYFVRAEAAGKTTRARIVRIRASE